MATKKHQTNGEQPKLVKDVPVKTADDTDKPVVTDLPNVSTVMPESDHGVDADLTDDDGNATHSTTTPSDYTELSDKDQKTYQSQFPSLDGEPELEIAKRGADIDAIRSNVYVKKFVARFHGPVELDQDFHDRQIVAMRREAIGHGLRLTGDGYFVGAEPHADRKSTILTYEVPCTPAKIADAVAAHEPPDEEYAHQLRADHQKSMDSIPAGDETKGDDSLNGDDDTK